MLVKENDKNESVENPVACFGTHVFGLERPNKKWCVFMKSKKEEEEKTKRVIQMQAKQRCCCFLFCIFYARPHNFSSSLAFSWISVHEESARMSKRSNRTNVKRGIWLGSQFYFSFFVFFSAYDSMCVYVIWAISFSLLK